MIVNLKQICPCVQLSCSGEEVGPILLQVPLIVQASSLTKNKMLKHGSDDIVSKSQTTDISSGASGNSVRQNFYLMDEVTIKFGSIPPSFAVF